MLPPPPQVLPQVPIHVGVDVDLPEYPCYHVHQRCQEGTHGSGECRRHCIHPHDGHPQDWAPHPHQHKHCDPVADGPDDGEGDTDQDDKDVVEDKFGVLVYDVEDLVEEGNGLCVLVLSKTVLKIQLQQT